MESWIEREWLYRGRIFSLRVGRARLEDGSIVEREVIEHPGGVAIIPLIGKSVHLIKQFRISIGREIIELPAGRLEAGDSPEIRAQKELEEELGFRAKELNHLISYYSSVGFTNERMHIFLGTDLEKTEKKPEWDENIRSIVLSLEEVEQKLNNNELEDSKTIIGLSSLLSYLGGKSG